MIRWRGAALNAAAIGALTLLLMLFPTATELLGTFGVTTLAVLVAGAVGLAITNMGSL